MHHDSLTPRDAGGILTVSLIAAVSVTGYPSALGQDTWLGILCAAGAALILALLYASMLKLGRGRGLYRMAGRAFGPAGGRLAGLLFGLYFTVLAAGTIGNYTQFLHLTSLPRTPNAVVALLLTLPCAYLACRGARAVGKWCLIATCLSFFALLVMTGLAASQLDLRHLLPVMDRSALNLARESAKIFCVPFGDLLLLLALCDGLEPEARPFALYPAGLGLGVVFLLVSFVRTCALLGAGLLERVYFQNYTAVSLLQLGPFLERIEALLAAVYLMAGFGRLAVCLLAGAKGMGAMTERPAGAGAVVALSGVAVVASLLLWPDAMAMELWLDTAVRYSPVFFLGLPFLIWIGLLAQQKKPA